MITTTFWLGFVSSALTSKDLSFFSDLVLQLPELKNKQENPEAATHGIRRTSMKVISEVKVRIVVI